MTTAEVMGRIILLGDPYPPARRLNARPFVELTGFVPHGLQQNFGVTGVVSVVVVPCDQEGVGIARRGQIKVLLELQGQ